MSEILKDYLTFRLERDLQINEEDSAKQKEYKKFFNNKLQQHGVESPAKLDNAGKKKFFGEIKAEWKGGKGAKTQESEENNDGDLIEEIVHSIAEGLQEEPKSLEQITEYISQILYENDSDLEINVEELLESLDDIFVALINEEDGETYFSITDDYRKILESGEQEKKKSFGDSIKSHFKRNRGAYIGTAAGLGTAVALGKTKAGQNFTGKKLSAGGAALTGAGALIGRRIDKKRIKANKAEGKHPDDFR